MIRLNEKNQKFLITGGTGFIGSSLVIELLKDGHQITVLTRKKIKDKNINYIQNLSGEFDYDIVINLCGEPIAKRWSDNNKDKIYNSRINITNDLVNIINNLNKPPKLIISGSAIGYYGVSDKLIFDEDSKQTERNLFSQKLCSDWEDAAKKVNEKTRLVLIRTGVVIGKDGGVIKRMLLPFKIGLGGKIGSGNQSLSWIAIRDVMGAIGYVIDNQSIRGAINLTSPHVTTNAIFAKNLAKILKRPCFFDMPKFVAKILFGKMAEELLLNGQNVYPKKLIESGYNFQVTNIEEAISEAL